MRNLWSKLVFMENGMNHKFITKIKEASWVDIVHIFVFLLAIIPSLFFRLKHKHMWLICEQKNEARDNGYWLYKYICENHPECDVVYAINPDCEDYEKVAKLGKTISYGTFQHWVYYLAAEKNISSQKGGKPNAAVCYVLEVYGIRKNIRVFLQHGIIENDLSFVHYENAKFSMLVTSTRREYEYVRDYFNYPGDEVRLLGLCRFDRLYRELEKNNPTCKVRQILVMPTWRSWISPPSHGKAEYENGQAVKKSRYYRTWNEFLHDKRLIDYLEKTDGQLVFYQHREMQKYEDLFESDCPRIRFATEHTDDVQQLIVDSGFMVTDYSSVAMDFAYMDKPLCYYQFDYEEFREKHYAEGYFDFERDGFGPVVKDETEILRVVQNYLEGQREDAKYGSRRKDFFTLKDAKNCERNYEAILRLQK